jgi:hypothetical protein
VFLCGSLYERDYLEDIGIFGNKLLKVPQRNGMGIHGLDSSGSGYGQIVDFCVHGNEPSGSIKCREFLD